ncbi:MAG: PHP domain-containing protein [Acidobacteria bacterium]|nr:PHP domain-containing protein [Acidobacteriota bacterium]
MIDLHTHSTASDGTLTPEALVDLAADQGLAAIALTDHDTVEGVPAALARGALCGLHVIPGVELSVHWDGSGQMHILGYYLRTDDTRLCERLGWLRDRRRERAQRIVEKLRGLGIQISFARVEGLAGGESIGRPHVARALLEAGAVGSLGEAFGRFLSPGRPGYESKEELGVEEGIGLVKASGGAAVLAHPATLKLNPAALAGCLKELKAFGLDGLEAVWSGHSAQQMAQFQALACNLDLLATGGSDFHGDNKPEIKLGTGRRNNVQVPDTLLDVLRQHCHKGAAAGA